MEWVIYKAFGCGVDMLGAVFMNGVWVLVILNILFLFYLVY
jgi:hypothetical protein